MRIIRNILIFALSIAFLAAAAVAFAPTLTREPESYLTVAKAGVEPGVFDVVERPDLRPTPPVNLDYESPLIEGAEGHMTLSGIAPNFWHLFAPTASGTEANPVIILFHGAGRDSLAMIDQWQDVAEAEGLVLIGLNAPSGGWPVDAPNGRLLNDILDEAGELYPLDRDRVFLYGHSAGSIMAQVVANRVIGPWRAVATHGGTVNPGFLHPIEDAPPVRHYLGSSDGIFDTATARLAGEQVTQTGHDHTLILIPGHTHWYYEGGPAFAAEAWDWFESL